MFKKKNKEVLSPEEIQTMAEKKTAQDWIPLKDVINSLAYTKDDYVVGYLCIEPFNLELLGNKEQNQVIESLTEALNGEDESFMWYATDRPADLEPYLEDLKYKAETSEKSIKKILLGKYASSTRNQLIAGDLVEKRFYMAVRAKNDKKVELLLHQRLNSIIDGLIGVGLQVKLGTDKSVYELFSIFADPSSSLFDTGDYNSGMYPRLE